jgi:uncharacterized protein YdeI (YjbR/CyaY-like superfamily)
MTSGNEIATRPFASAAEWEQWLSRNHETEKGLWLQIAKKASGIATVTYDEALDVALCYGWIDGQRKSDSDDYFLQKFTPRRPKSLWSKRNVGKIAQLTDAGRMRPAGLAEVEAAQKDGRWEAAYEGQKDMMIPEDFLAAVQRNEKAASVFATLNKANLYAIGFRLHNARTPETRARRFAALLEMLERGENPH